MSFWRKIKETISGEQRRVTTSQTKNVNHDASHYAIVDAEVGMNDKKVHDIGAIKFDGAVFHSTNKSELLRFLNNVDFVCGHNIIHHDLKYLFNNEGSCRQWQAMGDSGHALHFTSAFPRTTVSPLAERR